MGIDQNNSNINTNISTNINSNIIENTQLNLINNSNNIYTSNINNIYGSNLKKNKITSNNSLKKNKDIKFIWVDYNIDNKENTEYKKLLKTDVSLIECKLIEQGLEEIKKIKFERVILI